MQTWFTKKEPALPTKHELARSELYHTEIALLNAKAQQEDAQSVVEKYEARVRRLEAMLSSDPIEVEVYKEG